MPYAPHRLWRVDYWRKIHCFVRLLESSRIYLEIGNRPVGSVGFEERASCFLISGRKTVKQMIAKTRAFWPQRVCSLVSGTDVFMTPLRTSPLGQQLPASGEYSRVVCTTDRCKNDAGLAPSSAVCTCYLWPRIGQRHARKNSLLWRITGLRIFLLGWNTPSCRAVLWKVTGSSTVVSKLVCRSAPVRSFRLLRRQRIRILRIKKHSRTNFQNKIRSAIARESWLNLESVHVS
jgi:hypothetical protein